MLYYENIESVGAQHSVKGTMYEQSSNPSQENYFDPNLLDDFRTASDNSGMQFLTTNAAESTQQQWLSTTVHHCKWTGIECFGVGNMEGRVKSKTSLLEPFQQKLDS
jgi:hypothetical protein